MIPRVAAPKYRNMHRDPDIVNAFIWFKDFFPNNEWFRRKENIEKIISYPFQNTPPFSRLITEGTLLSVNDDQIGWYLYLVFTFLYEPHKYEFYQGARVIPIFKFIGMHLNKAKSIGGINKKIRKLINSSPANADATLFEILTAILWIRNEWNVKMIEEGKGGKTPDLLATKNGKTWQIECKRLRKTSEYAYNETKKRQTMISHISKFLIDRNILLDITFHVELIGLPDTYLKELIENKLTEIAEGTFISNNEIQIKVSFVDIEKIQEYLSKTDVKDHSPELFELIAGKETDYYSFTCGIKGDFYRVGEGDVSNVYVSKILNVYGIHCHCDAENALLTKARDIKRQVNDAIKQFGPESNAVIHIGVETLEGPEVEKRRIMKISESMKEINPQESNLRWIFCHYFQSYSNTKLDWAIDETVDRISGYANQPPPIDDLFLIAGGKDVREGEYHWNRQKP